MPKKFYIAATTVVLAASLAFGAVVFAEETRDTRMEKMEGKSMVKPLENILKRIEKFETKDFSFEGKLEREAPATITINPHGQTRITNGKVTAISGDIVTVEIWKLSFSVHKMPETKVIAGGKNEITFEQIAIGDMMNVLGKLDDSKIAFIHAEVIHDRTRLGKANEEERSRIQSLINDLIQRLNALRGRGQSPLVSPSGSPLPSSSPSVSATPVPSPGVSVSPSASPSTSSTP